MPDPITIVGGVASILQIINSVTKLAKGLNEVRESYNNVSLNITLVASQLTTIRAALEALHTWRTSDTIETEASKQLDQDLGLSLSCCAILISVIDGKLSESGYAPGVKQKIKYLWLEDTLKEYVSNLEGQVRALQLLLTIFQCRTATEQKQQLAKAESRTIIEQVRAETMTLGVGETDIDDAISILSQDPSVHFDVDSILMKSPAYIRVYGDRDPPRRKKVAGPPPPPPPRRKPAPKLSPPSPQAKAQSIATPSDVKPLSQPPSEPALQSSPPLENPSQPPTVPPRPKARSQPRQTHQRSPIQEQARSQGRINVWDFLGPGQEEKANDDAKMVMADSAQVFELPAAPAPGNAVQHDRVDIQALESAVSSSKHPPHAGRSHPNPERPDSPEAGPTIPRPDATKAIVTRGYSLPDSDMLGKPNVSSDQHSSLERFKTRLDCAFEEHKPLHPGEEDARLLRGPHEISDAVQMSNGRGALPSEDPEEHEELGRAETGSCDPAQTTKSGTLERKTESTQPVSKTLSIHSSVDLYDASIRNVPIEETSRPPSSQSLAVHEGTKAGSIASKDDELAAGIEDLSVLNQQLAAKQSEIEIANDGASLSFKTKTDAVHVSKEAEKPVNNSIEEPELVASPSVLGSSPQIIMTPSKEDMDGQAIDLSTLSGRETGIPASPTRPPPVPPTLAPSIPSIPMSSPPVNDLVGKNLGPETSTVSSRRDSSVFEASSTISSSEPSVDNTISSLQKSTSNTTATSISIDGPAAAREQAQAELRQLQNDLTAAKQRGDSEAAQESLQKSIDVVRRTYLAASTPVEARKSPSLRDRASFRRFTSFAGSSNGSALGDAAAAGDASSVRMLLDSKVNVDARSKAYMTPLMLAAMNGHVECLDVLKQRGADESAVDAKGRNALHLAVASNRPLVVAWLLTAYPPNRPQQIKHRSSILFKATDSLMSRTPKDLRETSDAEGSKPLHIAVGSANVDIVTALLAHGADIESKNNWGRTPLLQAIISNRRQSFDILLRADANVNALDARSMSPLHWAAKTGHVDMIEILLARGASRDDYDTDGNQPIHQAAWVGQSLVIESLLAERKSLEVRTRAGESLLHIACINSNLELATYLLQNAVEVNPWATPQPTLLDKLSGFKVSLTSLTPLHYACCKGDYELAILLLDREAWINAATPEGVTALMMAAESENTNMVNILLSRGAKVNASMPGTLLTALHIASRRGDLETVQQLCRAGADRQARTSASSGNYGRTPAEEAGAKCTDRIKRAAVEDYFQTIRQNIFRNARVRAMEARQSHEMLGHAYMTAPRGPSLDVRPAQPVSYAPWSQPQYHMVPPYGLQQPWPATYPGYPQQLQGQMPQQWYDPDPLTHVESPPPYQAGSSVPARLAAQAPVHRPRESTGPKYT